MTDVDANARGTEPHVALAARRHRRRGARGAARSASRGRSWRSRRSSRVLALLARGGRRLRAVAPPLARRERALHAAVAAGVRDRRRAARPRDCSSTTARYEWTLRLLRPRRRQRRRRRACRSRSCSRPANASRRTTRVTPTRRGEITFAPAELRLRSRARIVRSARAARRRRDAARLSRFRRDRALRVARRRPAAPGDRHQDVPAARRGHRLQAARRVPLRRLGSAHRLEGDAAARQADRARVSGRARPARHAAHRLRPPHARRRPARRRRHGALRPGAERRDAALVRRARAGRRRRRIDVRHAARARSACSRRAKARTR